MTKEKKEKIVKLIMEIQSGFGDTSQLITDLLLEVEDMDPEEVDKLYKELYK